MTKTFCDICGKEESIVYKYTVPGYSQFKATSCGVTIMTFNQASDVQIEICTECREKIRETLRIIR